MDSTGIILIGIGILSLLAAAFEWKWFFNSRKVQRIVKLLGYKKTRIFYYGLGIFGIIAGTLFTLGIWS